MNDARLETPRDAYPAVGNTSVGDGVVVGVVEGTVDHRLSEKDIVEGESIGWGVEGGKNGDGLGSGMLTTRCSFKDTDRVKCDARSERSVVGGGGGGGGEFEFLEGDGDLKGDDGSDSGFDSDRWEG